MLLPTSPSSFGILGVIVEQSWGRNQEPWLASQGEGLTPKTQREFACADDQLWEVGPNAHKDVAKYPKL
ncbi:hypothetical protein Nmel_017335 [Mimus melanotis]